MAGWPSGQVKSLGHPAAGPPGRLFPALVLIVCAAARAQIPAIPFSIKFSNGYAIENGIVTPNPPPDLVCRGDSLPDGVNYWILQFTGPVQHSWLASLAAAGLQPVAYLPKWAAVVRADRSHLSGTADFGFVDWVGRFQPAFKLESEVLESETTAALLAVPFPDHNVDSLARVIAKSGVTVLGLSGRTIRISADRAAAVRVASLSAVEWIQEIGQACLFNDNVQWVVQTGWQPSVPPDSSGRRIWHKGIRGRGVTLSIADVTVHPRHEMFEDPRVSIRDAGVYLHHRKIVAYKLFNGARFDNDSDWDYHGDQVSCTAVGDDEPSGGGSPYDGVAPDARLFFLSVYKGHDLTVDDADMTAFFDSLNGVQELPDPVQQNSIQTGYLNHWGKYDVMDASADAALWRYPDLLEIAAAGNEGPQFRRVCHPGCAKSILTVGGCGNGTGSDSLFPHSSPGPTHDRRVKPEIVAPAERIMTAVGSGVSDYVYSSGTSLSAPAVNGACVLIRQYLAEGWYPNGVPDSSRSIRNPSSALMRAMAIVSADPNVSQSQHTVPDSSIGWGRMDLDSVLYFAGDRRRLVLDDNRAGLATGERRSVFVRVTDTLPDLRACLAWTDTAGMPNATTELVNDLDLEVASPRRPGGVRQYFHGNLYLQGYSQSPENRDSFDGLNTAECFRWHPGIADTGAWEFTVIAENVFTPRQAYGLAITGGCKLREAGLTKDRPAPVPLRLEPLATPVRRSAALRYDLPRPGEVVIQALDVGGRVVKTLRQDFEAAGLHAVTWDLSDNQGSRVPAGVYFARLDCDGDRLIRKLVVTD